MNFKNRLVNICTVKMSLKKAEIVISMDRTISAENGGVLCTIYA